MPRRHKGETSGSHSDFDPVMDALFARFRAVRQAQTGLDVVPDKVRILPKDRLRRIARAEHGEDMLNGDPQVANDRLAAERPGGR